MDTYIGTSVVLEPPSLGVAPTDINTEEVLAEYGLDGIRNNTTITQIESGQTIVATETSTASRLTIEDLIEEATYTPVEHIKENPLSLLIDESTSRFSGASWYKEIQTYSVTLAGLGGIGSWVALLLSRVKPCSINIYDNDIVEVANMSGQLYSNDQVRKYKVDATYENLNSFSNYRSCFCHREMWNSSRLGKYIMICGFDNMEARKAYFNSWVQYINSNLVDDKSKCLFIDGRLNMNEFQVFCIKGDDSVSIKKYSKEYLFTDSEAESDGCSTKQTSHCACMIASVIVNLFVNFVANTLDPVVPFDLPFKTYYNSNIMYLKTEL